jgi:hypothetical protein
MGKFFYGESAAEIEIEDRTLAHLQIAIISKLRRGESFQFTWDDGDGEKSIRQSIWLSPSIPLRFAIKSNPTHAANRRWIEDMTTAANNSGTLRIIEEPSA